MKLDADPFLADELVPDTGAVFSPCECYRYRLWRYWGDGAGGWCVFLLCNPSTATATTDDPTIRRCIGFAKSWRMSGVRILNLFAIRSTDPNELSRVSYADAIGPDNDSHIEWVTRPTFAGSEQRIVCAWGCPGNTDTRKIIRHRARDVLATLKALQRPLWCLGRAQDGAPRHPLYLARDTALEPFGGGLARAGEGV
jgi:hypothetical protein